jgi:hypothetical protein
VVYDAVGENGWTAWTVGVPVGVSVFGVITVLVSRNLLLWQVSKLVFGIGVSGVVGTVIAPVPVYNAVPFRILMLLAYPAVNNGVSGQAITLVLAAFVLTWDELKVVPPS